MANEDPANQNLQQRFTAFFKGWLVRQVSYFEQMQALISETTGGGEDSTKAEKCMHLVQQVLDHYKEYYDEKLKAANEDVFLVFSLPWISSFERTLCWLSGFKPTLLFQLVSRVIENLSAEQVERIEIVRDQIKNKEREIGEAMAKVQEGLTTPTLLELARKERRLVDEEIDEIDGEMEKLKGAMLVVMGRADGLRGMAAEELLEILSPMQKVKLMAGKAKFWVQARRLGMERDARREFN